MPSPPRRPTFAILTLLGLASLASLPACQSAPAPSIVTPRDAAPLSDRDESEPARDLQRERRLRMGK